MSATVVTGGLGFIGAALCEALARRGHRVVCVDRLTGAYSAERGRTAAERLRANPGVAVLEADARVLPLDGAGAVVHLAALPGVRARRSRGELWRENVALTERLVRRAARAGARIVVASSSAVYGNAGVLPTPEHAPAAPLGPYAASKLAAERACLRAARQGADALVVRPFTVFGPGQRPDMAIARWIASLLGAEPLDWHPHPVAARELTYVDDAVAGLIAALERGRAGQVYNIAGSGSHRLDEVLELLERAIGRRARRRRASPSPLEAVATSACGAKAALELGYRPRVSLEEGIRRQLAAATGSPVELAA